MGKWDQMFVLSIGLHWTEVVAATEVGAETGAQFGVPIGTEVATLDFLPEKGNISRVRFIMELYFNNLNLIKM